MIDLREIRDTLADNVPQLRHVGTARNFGAVKAELIVWPSAWVVPLAEASGPNRFQSNKILDQRVDFRFGVIWAIRDIADRTGATALTEADAIRAAGIDAVARFLPTDATSTCLPVSGRLLSGIGKDGQMYWQDDFKVSFNRRIQIV